MDSDSRAHRIQDWTDLHNTSREVLHASEAAALLGVDRRTIVRAVERGELAGQKLGKKCFVPRSAIVSIAGLKGAA